MLPFLIGASASYVVDEVIVEVAVILTRYQKVLETESA
jgi:hypothetical protein